MCVYQSTAWAVLSPFFEDSRKMDDEEVADETDMLVVGPVIGDPCGLDEKARQQYDEDPGQGEEIVSLVVESFRSRDVPADRRP